MSSRPLRWYDALRLSSAYLGVTTLIQSLAPLVLPLLVQRFVGEARQGAAFGTLRLWSLMVALLTQALMGLLSDRCTLRWGRRRPFILAGTLGNLVSVGAIAWTVKLDGVTGYWALFAFCLLFQFATNTALGALHGLIPDLAPESQRGTFSAVKSLFELSVPIILVSFIIAPLIVEGHMVWALVVGMGALVVTTAVTLTVREVPLSVAPPPVNWNPFVRLLMMTGVFTVAILVLGAFVKVVGRVVLAVAFPVSGVVAAMGLVGLGAMLTAVAMGVWSGVHISLESPDDAKTRVRQRAFTWWVVGRLAFLVGVNNIASFAVYFIQGRLGIPNEQAAEPASRLMMIVGLCILLAALPSGWLADRFGRKQLVIISSLLAGAGTAVALATPRLSLIYIGGCCIGMATGLFYTSDWALGTDLIPPNEAGRYLGLANLAGAGAGAVGAYIGGPVADYFTAHLPQHPGMGYVILFVIYGVLFVFSALALIGVQESHFA